MNLDELDLSAPYKATVVRSERITSEDAAEVRRIVLGIEDPTFAYTEGQSIAVLAPSPPGRDSPSRPRMYSIAGGQQGEEHPSEIVVCVRRCQSIDEDTGQRRPGVTSNFLCDAQPGTTISICGPYGRPFLPPRDKTSNILMIGAGAGMGPFRAFLKHLHQQRPDWAGRVRLFYGPHTGLEWMYQNEQGQDLAQYYEEGTFAVFEALSAHAPPGFAAAEQTASGHLDEVWELVQDRKTHVYLVGLTRVADALDEALAGKAEAAEQWARQKRTLIRQRRWSEILYD